MNLRKDHYWYCWFSNRAVIGHVDLGFSCTGHNGVRKHSVGDFFDTIWEPRLATEVDLSNGTQPLAMDILAPVTMKNAAKCDTSCELQNSVNHQIFERKLRC